MTKSELETGMIVTLRNGNEYVFFKDFAVDDDYCMKNDNEGIIVNGQLPSWARIKNYSNDLKHNTYQDLDIVKVEIPSHPYAFTNIPYDKRDRKLMWERKEPKKMTVSEIEAILGYKVEIVSEEK